MEHPVWIQILIERKGLDPTAITASMAIRDLLGMGDSLLELRRGHLHELVLDCGSADQRGDDLLARAALWLDHVPHLWNQNRERAWLRLAAPGEARRTVEVTPSGFHDVASLAHLESAALDHVLLWPREGTKPPADLARSVHPARLLLFGAAELYSLRWSPELDLRERAARTEAVGPVRSRHEGLLVHPHFQDHRRWSGPVPLPLFGGTPDA